MLPNEIYSLKKCSDSLFYGKVSNDLIIKPRYIVPRTNKDGSYRLMTMAVCSSDGCLGTIHLYDKNNGFERVGVAYIYVLPNKRFFKMDFWDIEDNDYYVNEYLKNAIKGNSSLVEIESTYYKICKQFGVESKFNEIYNEHLSQEAYLNGLISGAKNKDHYKDFIADEILPLLKRDYDIHAIPMSNVVDFKNDLQCALNKIEHSVDEILLIDKNNMSPFQYVISSNDFTYNTRTISNLIKDKIGMLTNKIPSMHMTKWGTSFEFESDWED